MRPAEHDEEEEEEEEAPLIDLNLCDEFFLGVHAPVTIYSLAVISRPTGPAQLLLASATKVYHVACDEEGELIMKEVEIPCLAGSSRIVSLAAYADQFTGELHYAFTTITGEGDDVIRKYSLHIHQEHQSCQEVALLYQPYQLLYSSVPSTVGEQDVWVITGEQLTVVGHPLHHQEETLLLSDLNHTTMPNSTASPPATADLSAHTPESHTGPLAGGALPSDSFTENVSPERAFLSHADFCAENQNLQPDAEHHSSEPSSTSSTSNNSKESVNGTIFNKRATGGNTEEVPTPLVADPDPLSEAGTSRYALLDAHEYFPEFRLVNSRIIKAHIMRTPDDTRRLTAVCGEDGSVCVFDVQLREENAPSWGCAPTSDTPAPTPDKGLFQSSASTPKTVPTASSAKKIRKRKKKKRGSSGECSSAGSSGHASLSGSDTAPPSASPVCELPHVLACRLLRERRFAFEHPMSSVQLFRAVEPPQPYPDTLPVVQGLPPSTPDLRTPVYSLLATSTITRSHVFTSVLFKHRSRSHPLPESGRHDSVMCSLVAPLTGDWRCYLLIGTFDQTVLIYQRVRKEASSEDPEFELQLKLRVGAPVLSLQFADVTGVKRLVVLTAAGLQTFVPEPRLTASCITQRLQQLLAFKLRHIDGNTGGLEDDDSDGSPQDKSLKRATRFLDF